MLDKKVDGVLSEEFVKLFKRKTYAQFKEKIMLSKKICYHEFRKFCGRSFGIKKSEANAILDILSDHGIVELSSSGFVVRNKKFFNV